jgi:hypothetical protein
VGIGAFAYLVGALLQILIRKDTSYWRYLFPSLIITVLGADFQFIVANVRARMYPDISIALYNHTFSNILYSNNYSVLIFKQLYVTKQMPNQASLGAGTLYIRATESDF